MSTIGLKTCICYSTPPNALTYCGPDWEDITHYRKSKIIDASLKDHLAKYQTLFSYLSFIAAENGIADQFDQKVVKAYWIGNNLLHKLDPNRFYYHLKDSLSLKKRLSRLELEQLFGKIPKGALPNHSFHVLNVPWRTGHLPIEHTIDTMDQCRISWGKVTKVTKNNIEIVSPRLKYDGVILSLTKPQLYYIENPLLDIDININKGDWASSHWGVFCDKLSIIEVKNLSYYTDLAIKLANEDIRTREHFN